MGGALPHHVRNGGGLEMNEWTSRHHFECVFRELQHVQRRIDECRYYLGCVRRELRYCDYSFMSSWLDSLHDSVSRSASSFERYSKTLCDTPQR